MTEKVSKQPKKEKLHRCIGSVHGQENGPTLIFFAGIHGNEMAGVKAMQRFFENLKTASLSFNGSIFGIRGNILAQLQEKRFVEDDLNRLWTSDGVALIKSKPTVARTVEENELVGIEELISEILNTRSPPFYFIDFHTTSSKTLPFITINDALINRKFSKLYPVPTILGIEEYLEGPLLSYLNKKGYVSLGFESGQHTDSVAVENAISFMWLTLVFSRVLSKSDVPEHESYYGQLQNSAKGDTGFYEVIYRHDLEENPQFIMSPGYKSFQNVKKGDTIGVQNEKSVLAEKDAIMFMPLYQKQGAEGFFLIKRIPNWALYLSTLLRSVKIDALLTLLPGISWRDKNKDGLLVNLKIARFFAKSFFHLLGYRNRTLNKSHLLLYNRERSAKNKMYSDESWF